MSESIKKKEFLKQELKEVFKLKPNNRHWSVPVLASLWVNKGARVSGRFVVWGDHDKALSSIPGNFCINEDGYLQLREDGTRMERE